MPTATSKYVWDCATIHVEDWSGTLAEPFFVPTPKPYVVEGKNLDDGQKENLLRKAETLWKILALLGIGVAEAWEKDYTLHTEALRKLREIAQNKMSDWLGGRGNIPEHVCKEAIQLIHHLRASA